MIFLFYICVALLTLLVIYRIFCKKKRHQWYIRRASQLYNRINDKKQHYSSAQVFNYLRHINPYVFEELLLIAFQRKGYRIIRNLRYSGDGGIDGYVIVDRKKIPIQAKRYSSYIRGEHVVEFARVIQLYRKPFGLFIHTGRTGNAAGDPSCSVVRIISGEKLLDLLFIDRTFVIPS